MQQPLNFLCVCIHFSIGHSVYAPFVENIVSYLDYLLTGICIGIRKIKRNIFLIFHVGLCYSSKSGFGFVQFDWLSLNEFQFSVEGFHHHHHHHHLDLSTVWLSETYYMY